MVSLLSRRKRKEKSRVKAEKKSSEDGSTTLSTKRDGTDDSIDTNCSVHSENNNYYPSTFYGNKTTSSSMLMYAQMSTTIASALSKEEFGSQENSLYSPDAKYLSKVIHPVECKRDIFVESVTPVKFKGKNQKRLTRKQSIYHANVGREHSPYHESNNVHYAHALESGRKYPQLRRESTTDTEASVTENNDRNLPIRKDSLFGAMLTKCKNQDDPSPYDEQQSVVDADADAKKCKNDNDDKSLTLTYSSDEDKENGGKLMKAVRSTVMANKRLSIDTSNTAMSDPRCSPSDVPRIRAINNQHSRNTLFRSNNTNHLRVDTGQNGYEGNATTRPINRSGPSMGITNGDMNGQSRSGSLYGGHSSGTRSVGENMDVSPSSTVSSLTLPAELEYYTPRDVVHAVSLPIISEDDTTFSEI